MRMTNYLNRDMQLLYGMVCLVVFCGAATAQDAVEESDPRGPKFAGPIPSITVAVGRDAILKCVVDNLKDYRVAWIHVDKQLLLTIHTHVITRNNNVAVSHHNFRTWSLHLKNVQPEDSGYYMCQINTQPMISQVGYLDIVVPPEFINDQPDGRNVSVMENGNATLTCRATGNPAPVIKWRREDGQPMPIGQQVSFFDGEELKLLKVSRQSMGAYRCIASNGVPPTISRRVFLEVAFPPMIWIPNQLVGAAEGESTTLECITEAHPAATNLWTRDGYVIATSTEKFDTFLITNAYKVHMKLAVKNIRQLDYGVYKCISKNALGETEGSVNLYKVKPKPIRKPPSTAIPPTEPTEMNIPEPIVEEQTAKHEIEEDMFSQLQEIDSEYETDAGSEMALNIWIAIAAIFLLFSGA